MWITNEAESETKSVSMCVPQGSMFGAIALFNI